MTPSLPSFAAALPDSTLDAIYQTEWGERKLSLVFNCACFPVIYYSDFDEDETHTLLKSVFDARTSLSVDDCHTYNQWAHAEGLLSRIPISLSGICVKPNPKYKHPDCKNLSKWTCGGCGRTWLPGSLVDPICVVYPDPWWMNYIGEEIRALIAANGGPSKTDPLVFFPDGAHRNGRTKQYTMPLL
jgi:hypothetical protein